MTPSPRIAAFMRDFEKLRLSAYMPTKNDVPTIGYGATGPEIKLGMKWTLEQAEARWDADLARFAAGVASAIGQSPTTQAQFDAMVSLAFNIGLTGFKSSTLLKLHKAGEHTAAKLQFGRWSKQAGVTLNGLVKRRAAEAAIYGGEA